MSLAPIARGHQATELKISKRSERKEMRGGRDERTGKGREEKGREGRGKKKNPHSPYKPV